MSIEELIAPQPRAGTTPDRALPYPSPTDPVAQGAANIQALANAIDPLLGATRIAEALLTVAASSILISGINQTYRHLVLLTNLWSDQASAQNVFLEVNAFVDPATYVREYLFAQAGNSPLAATANDKFSGMFASGTSVGGDGSANGLLVLFNYKTVSRRNWLAIGGQAATPQVGLLWGNWMSGSPLTSLGLTPAAGQFKAGSRATLYGLR